MKNIPLKPDIPADDSGEKKFYQKDIVTQDAEGYAIYKKLIFDMNLNSECLYWADGFKTIRVDYIDNEFKISKATYTEKSLKSFVSIANWIPLMKYLIRHKKFMSKPKIVVKAYVTKENLSEEKGYSSRGDLRFLDKKTFIENATTSNVEFDTDRGSIICYTPLIAPVDIRNDLIEELLRIIYPEENEYKSIVDFLSLYSFEDRCGLAKPTFIMYGHQRGTGKNFIFETFMGAIYAGQICPLPPNYDKFTAYLEKKFVYIDENNEASLDPIRLYNFVKRMSGQKFNMVNRKSVEAKMILNGTFFGIASNEKALNMRDFISDPSQNQFLVINTIGEKHSAFKAFKKKIACAGYHGLQHLVDRCLGHFVFSVLFKNYERIKIENKRLSFRYGMNVPISEGLIKLMQMSVSTSDKGAISMLDNLTTGNKKEYDLIPELGYHFLEFQNKESDRANGFLSNKLLKSLCKQERIGETAFYLFLDKYDLIRSNKFRRYVYGCKPVGILLDFGRLIYLFENNAWSGIKEGYDTDTGFEQEDIFSELVED